MKLIVKSNLLFVFLLFVNSTLLADDTIFMVRGPAQGELYIGTPYYSTYDGGYEEHTYYAIFHSFDNGEHIDIKYVSEDLLTDSLHINCPWLVSDATPGVIYCRSQNYKLWISYTYGEDWNFIETTSGYYTSGCIEGEIYKFCADYQGRLWRSINYGEDFNAVNDSAKYVMEIGNQNGELYGIDGNYEDGFEIHYCNDYGQTFSNIPLDSTIAGYFYSGNYPKLSRGTETGEVYLITWHEPGRPFIYRSTDYGQTYELRYQFPTISAYEWSTHYTAGTQPGSFYFIKYRWVWAYSYSEDDVIAYIEMYIYYSDDYAGTFSEVYHHTLHPDSLSVEENEVIEVKDINLINYPNPFNPSTIISFSVAQSPSTVEIDIYNLKGQKVKTLPITLSRVEGRGTTKTSVVWDGTNQAGEMVSSGIYLYKLNLVNSPIKKMILLK